MKKFKAESQKLLNMMINSIYTNKEIYLRELVSNASDAIDKRYFNSLKDGETGVNREDFTIDVTVDKEKRTLVVADNGCGMDEGELDKNLGVLAHSGTMEFKEENKGEAIGQFGVGFYSAFMASSSVTVLSRKYGSDKAYMWESDGMEGYSITEAQKDGCGTEVILHIKDNGEENFDEYLEKDEIRRIIKKYSDYIRYPIMLHCGEENERVNSGIPLWKKPKEEVSEEEFNNFYRERFHDYNLPLEVFPVNVEGAVSFTSLVYIPSVAPMDYYSRDFECGLELYSNGVLIMEKCKELIPDYFGFVKGVVDSSDFALNISRETVAHNRQLNVINTALCKRVKKELLKLLTQQRDKYNSFFDNFGTQLKYGIYESYGANRDILEELLLFKTLNSDSPLLLSEYKSNMKDGQKYIYYANGSADIVKSLPQIEECREKGYDVLCLTQPIDELMLKILTSYADVEYKSINEGSERNTERKADEFEQKLLDFMKESLGDKVEKVVLSPGLKTHAVCLSAVGDISIEMEKIYAQIMQGANIKAKKVLEINPEHKLFVRIKTLFESDKDSLKKLTDVLYAQALLIEGVSPENPSRFVDEVCELLGN